jgi:hypothetical protein
MEFQKIFIKDDGTTSMRCPACMAEKSMHYEKLPRRHKFIVKCLCGSSFGVQFEFRKKYRKSVNLDGIILKQEQGDKWGKTLSESHVTKIKPANCKITNISVAGAGFNLIDSVKINENDLIIIKFNLDNSAATMIEKKAIVRLVKDKYIGCEFAEKDEFDTALKFYFL